MQWNGDIDLSERQYTARLIIERSLKRGWRVASFKSSPAILFIYPLPDGAPIKLFSSLTNDTSFVAAKIARDKHITNELLGQAGLPVPAELLINGGSSPSEDIYQEFIAAHNRVVVKPLDAAHGKGITVGVTNIEKLHQAIELAREYSHGGKVLIQEELHGHDIRVVAVGYEFYESMSRIPPHVIGDGVKTVKELIEAVNRHEDRGETYKSKLAFISLDKAENFLGRDELERILPLDEEVQVMGISNVGTGGTRINTKDSIPDFLQEMAVKAAQTIELPICGVDFMVAKMPTPQSTLEELQPKIIEVNSCPSLTNYEDVRSEEQLGAIDKYLDYLESIG